MEGGRGERAVFMIFNKIEKWFEEVDGEVRCEG